MLFGISQVSLSQQQAARDLGVSWVSLEPSVFWFDVEKHIETNPGVYDWTALDNEVKKLQNSGFDFVMLLSPIINAFTEATRTTIGTLIQSEMTEHGYDSTSAFIHLMRDHDLVKNYDLSPNTPDRLEKLKTFVRAAVDRYDFDGKNDMPGLKYEARNWHVGEEWPMQDGDAALYLSILKAVFPVIKAENSKAIVILPGLAGNYSQYFAFADGYIADPDAGRMKDLNLVLTQNQIKLRPIIRVEKPEYESILRDGKGFFDATDIHLYEPKETYMEGELDWLNAKLQEYGSPCPIWVIEGGGPFRNPPDDPNNPQGDPYYGVWTPKDGAEFVVKLLVMSVPKGVVRNHWGVGTEQGGYWRGPWDAMGLLNFDGSKKTTYYTYKVLIGKLNNFTTVSDRSFTAGSRVRLFEFTLSNGKKVYVAWNFLDAISQFDLSGILGDVQVKMTSIVTALNPDGTPIGPFETQASSRSVPLSVTPIFIEIL